MTQITSQIIPPELVGFLQTQRCLTIATAGMEPWICNVYYGATEQCSLYFVSGDDKVHSLKILENPRVAFATSWYNPETYSDRKAIQGSGFCSLATDNSDIEQGVGLHNANFPEFSDRITLDYIKSENNSTRVWVIRPKRIKFWNDELYGEQCWQEFEFT